MEQLTNKFTLDYFYTNRKRIFSSEMTGLNLYILNDWYVLQDLSTNDIIELVTDKFNELIRETKTHLKDAFDRKINKSINFILFKKDVSKLESLKEKELEILPDFKELSNYGDE